MKYSKRLSEIKAGKTWKFHGGVHPTEHKKETSNIAIQDLPLPKILIVPIKQHSGEPGEIIVKVGDYVKKGQALTLACNRYQLPVHAPTSGTINSIGVYNACHPSGLQDTAITIYPDGKDTWTELTPLQDYQNAPIEELISKINNAGIVGMGGAGFPTGSKIKSALEKTNILIINGCECEPYLTSDDRIMQERSAEIITGIRILQKIYEPEVTLLAIEENKPQAIKAMKLALMGFEDSISLRVLPVLYPTGAARPLIQTLTGIEVGYNHRSNDYGITMHNVGSTYAVKRAVINGEPLIERIVTVTGGNFVKNGNVIVKNGTLVRHILNNFHLKNNHELSIILGGPMMGFNIESPDVPLTKTINCIIAPADGELPLRHSYLNCIKCGKCQDVCPSRLVPYALLSHSRAFNFEELTNSNIKDCIECGCCTFVCSSHIPLVQEFRIAKAAMKKEKAYEKFKKNTQELIAFKQLRLENERKDREARINALKKPTTINNSAKINEVAEKVSVAPNDPIAIAKAKALALAKAKAANQNVATEENSEKHPETVTTNNNAQALALAKAKALALAKAKASNQNIATENNSEKHPETVTTNNNAQALALAKAKAKALALAKDKASNQNIATEENSEKQPETVTTNNNAQALALAKAKALALAKAKALAQSKNNNEE